MKLKPKRRYLIEPSPQELRRETVPLLASEVGGGCQAALTFVVIGE